MDAIPAGLADARQIFEPVARQPRNRCAEVEEVAFLSALVAHISVPGSMAKWYTNRTALPLNPCSTCSLSGQLSWACRLDLFALSSEKKHSQELAGKR